jgi:uncharacterized HAD superfamily protein
MQSNLILTDVDGVILDWEYAFNVWAQTHGYSRIEGGQYKYSIGKRYGISEEEAKRLIKYFNESAAIGFLPPLRDSMYYLKRLHEKHGFIFHAITSLSKDQHSCKLREMNIKKLFGETAFEKFVFLDTGADKDEALEPYRNSGLYFIEDKIDNCITGANMGLSSLLMTHGHNMDFIHSEIRHVKNWKQIYEIVTGE